MNIMAVIPARGGSKSIPKKSIVPLGGFPLIAFSIFAGKMSKHINRVLVSTDSEEIASVSREFGAETPFLRPSELAQDDSRDIGFFQHCIQRLRETEGTLPDLFIHLRPTTPLRDPKIIDQAIVEFLATPKATSLRSAHPASESPFKWFQKGEDGNFRAIREGDSNDFLNAPRQMFPQAFIPDGYVDILRPSFLVENNLLYGPRMKAFVTPVTHEVDSPEDLELLNFDLSRGEHPVFCMLQKFQDTGEFPFLREGDKK